MRFASMIFGAILAICLTNAAFASDFVASTSDAGGSSIISASGGEGGGSNGWMKMEVSSQQLDSCVVWNKDPSSNWFYLSHFSQKLAGPCDHYNYAKWFQGGAEILVGQSLRRYQVSYGFDRKLGRAWIEIGRDPGYQKNLGVYYESDLFTIDSNRYKISGLSYDTASDTIVYNGNVIAQVTQKLGIFGLKYFDISGAKPKLDIVEKTIDDGMANIYQAPFAVVTLPVPDSK